MSDKHKTRDDLKIVPPTTADEAASTLTSLRDELRVMFTNHAGRRSPADRVESIAELIKEDLEEADLQTSELKFTFMRMGLGIQASKLEAVLSSIRSLKSSDTATEEGAVVEEHSKIA